MLDVIEKFAQAPQNPFGNAIVFSIDKKFIPYFSVTYASLVANLNPKLTYDVFVLNTDLTEEDFQRISCISTGNINLKFINVKDAVSEIYADIVFYEAGIWSLAVWYRLLIPVLFKKYSKVLYLDSDLCITESIDVFFNLPSEKYCCAASRDACASIFHNIFGVSLKDSINIEKPEDYFNSGILLWFIENINTEKFVANVKDVIRTKTIICSDQDVLNSIFHGKCKLLDASYNVQVNQVVCHRGFIEKLSNSARQDYIFGLRNPKIVHYVTHIKPWNSVDCMMSDYFWKFASFSPYCYDLKKELSTTIENSNRINRFLYIAVNRRIFAIKQHFYSCLRPFGSRYEKKYSKYKALLSEYYSLLSVFGSNI